MHVSIIKKHGMTVPAGQIWGFRAWRDNIQLLRHLFEGREGGENLGKSSWRRYLCTQKVELLGREDNFSILHRRVWKHVWAPVFIRP